MSNPHDPDQVELLLAPPSSAYLSHQKIPAPDGLSWDRLNNFAPASSQSTTETASFNEYPPVWGDKSQYPHERAPHYTMDSMTADQLKHLPKSTSLYLALCSTYGAHNIAPLPNWLADTGDTAQKQWFKSGPNALLYFLYRSPKHKQRLKALASTSICCSCKPCLASHMGNIYSRVDTQFCNLFWCDTCYYLLFPPCAPFYFILNNFVRTQWLRFYGGDNDMFSAPGSKALGDSWTQIQLRHDIYTTLRAGGVEVSVPWKATICCQYFWCSGLVNMHQAAILDYVFYKRYGFTMGVDPLAIAPQSPLAAQDAIYGSDSDALRWTQNRFHDEKRCRALFATPHRTFRSGTPTRSLPRSRESNALDAWNESWDVDTHDEDGQLSQSTHYKMYPGPFPSYPLLTEWTDLPAAIQHHNTLWKDHHKIVFDDAFAQNTPIGPVQMG